MRILNVTLSIDPLDTGMSERTFQMSRALARLGHEVEVLVANKGLSEERLQAIAPAKVTAVNLINRRYFVPRVMPGALRSIVGRADIVHLMGYWSALNILVVRALRHARKPYVFCPAGSSRIYGRSRIIKRIYVALFGAKMVRDAARIIAITRQEKEMLVSNGVPDEKVVIIPNAIEGEENNRADPDEFRRSAGIARPFLLALGRLNPIKGPDLLLDAYLESDLVRDFDLVFAGSDEGMAGSLARRAEQAGATGAVHFVGHIGGERKSQALRAAEFIVVPSRHEAMSIVAIESGAAGKPVVVTDQCGFEVVEEIGGGFVVPASVEGLRSGLHRMAAADRQSMGSRMRDFVLEHYTWDSMARRYEGLYAEILGAAS